MESNIGRKPAILSCSCAGARGPASAATLAAVILLVIVLACCLLRGLRRREGFASARAHEVYGSSRDLFERTRGGAAYSEFRARVKGADAVLYTDVRGLWKKGALNPDAVQGVL
jgi:hypothetical protein